MIHFFELTPLELEEDSTTSKSEHFLYRNFPGCRSPEDPDGTNFECSKLTVKWRFTRNYPEEDLENNREIWHKIFMCIYKKLMEGRSVDENFCANLTASTADRNILGIILEARESWRCHINDYGYTADQMEWAMKLSRIWIPVYRKHAKPRVSPVTGKLRIWRFIRWSRI